MIGISVSLSDQGKSSPLDPAALTDLAREVLAGEGIAAPAELSVSLVSTEEMAELNERYRGVEGPTDVLSFAIDGPGPTEGEGVPRLVGDVVICPQVARRNAAERGRSPEEEMALLTVHGVLHLLGMDHEVPAEAEVMEAREAHYLGGRWLPQ